MYIEEVKRISAQLKRVSFKASEDYLIEALEEFKELNSFEGDIEIRLELGKLYIASKKFNEGFEILNIILEDCVRSKSYFNF